MNPYSDMSNKYNCWPMRMIIYNLSLWLCLRKKFMMLIMLTSRPKQPDNDIDIFFDPLIDDLKLLKKKELNDYYKLKLYHSYKFD